MISKLYAWFINKNKSTHFIALAALGLAGAYTGYAPFHAMVLKYFCMLPIDVQTTITTGFFIAALYKSGAIKFKTTTTQTTTLETITTVDPAPKTPAA